MHHYVSCHFRFSCRFRAIWLNFVGLEAILILTAYAGLVVFAYYYSALCDPLKAGVRISIFFIIFSNSLLN